MTGPTGDPMNKQPEAWSSSKVGNIVAECLSCGAYLPLETSQRDQRQARTWARRHAEEKSGHHAVVEVTRIRSYLAAPQETP